MQRHPSTGEAVRYGILEKVAAVRKVDMCELEALWEAIDPDAIDALVESGFDGTVEFDYGECFVIFDGDARVIVATNQQ